jgi:hypothetical protein
MVLQIAVLIGPAITLALIASNKKLMGRYYLKGYNKIIYWVFFFLILGTGIVSMFLLL